MSQLHFDSGRALRVLVAEKDFEAMKAPVLAARDTLPGPPGGRIGLFRRLAGIASEL